LLYDIIYLLAAVLGSPVLLWLAIAKPRVRAGVLSRLGLRRPQLPGDGPRIWVHGVSVGEVLASRPLVRELRAVLPDHEVVISTTTGTGYEVARRHLRDCPTIFYPLDLRWSVRRVLRAVRPSLIVLVELEIWPNFLLEADRLGIPVVLVNGRITQRSQRGYARIGWLLRRPLGTIRRFLVQSEAYRSRFLELGVPAAKIAVTGSMKYDALPGPVPASSGAAMRADLGLAPKVPVIVGGSTHPGEEAALIRVYRSLREEHPGLRLVLVPRHNERVGGLLAELERLGDRGVRRTELAAADGNGEPVVVVDTMGELQGIYRAADVVFVGGSLVPVGGQNVLEPCALGKAVLVGPYTDNFREAIEELREARGLVEVADEKELRAACAELLSDPRARSELGERARAALEQRRGAAHRTAAELAEVLAAPGGGGSPRAESSGEAPSTPAPTPESAVSAEASPPAGAPSQADADADANAAAAVVENEAA